MLNLTYVVTWFAMSCWIDLISCIIFMHYNLATKIRFAHDVNPLNTIVIIIINIKQYGIKHSSMVMTNPRKKQHHNSSIGFIKLLELPCFFFAQQRMSRPAVQGGHLQHHVLWEWEGPGEPVMPIKYVGFSHGYSKIDGSNRWKILSEDMFFTNATCSQPLFLFTLCTG